MKEKVWSVNVEVQSSEQEGIKKQKYLQPAETERTAGHSSLHPMTANLHILPPPKGTVCLYIVPSHIQPICKSHKTQ